MTKEDANVVKMRVNISGYGGKAVSLFAAFDCGNDILLIAKEGEYETVERAGYLRITNQAQDQFSDAVYTDDDTRDAIAAYFELDGLGLLTVGPKVGRCTPGNKIERDGMNATGMMYRIQPDISNGQVAVLVACLYASRQRNVAGTQAFMEEMLEMVTIW